MTTNAAWRLGVLVLGLLGAAAQAADCGPYRVGLKSYPLVYERDPNREGEYRGLDKDFFDQLSARSGCRFELELESQPRIWSRLRGGSLDITSWALPTTERQAWVRFIPLARSSPVALTWRSQAAAEEADFLARPGLRAVVVRDTSYGPSYDALLQGLRAQGRVSEVGDLDAALRVFMAGRVSLLISYPWVLAGALRERGDELMMSDWHPQEPGVLSGLALSRRTVSAADQRRLLDALQAMQRDGSLERLLRQHLPRVGLTPLTRVEAQP